MTDKPKGRRAPKRKPKTPPAEVDARGRPSTFTRDIANKVCGYLVEGMTLRQVSRQDGMPGESTIRMWAANNAGAEIEEYEGFFAQYTRSRRVGYESMAEETIEISDDGSNDWMEREGKTDYNGDAVARARLRVDTRKWLVSKALPKIYGDKTILTGGGEDDDPIRVEAKLDDKELARQVAFILAKGMKEANDG